MAVVETSSSGLVVIITKYRRDTMEHERASIDVTVVLKKTTAPSAQPPPRPVPRLLGTVTPEPLIQAIGSLNKGPERAPWLGSTARDSRLYGGLVTMIERE